MVKGLFELFSFGEVCVSGTIPIDIVSSFFFQHHLLITAFTAAESLLTSAATNTESKMHS